MLDLNRSLLRHDPTLIRVIAESWGVDLTGLAPNEAAKQLADHVLAADLPAEIGDLPADEQAAIQALLAAGGKIKVDPFLRQYGEIRPIGPGRLTRERPWLSPAGPAEALWYRGLLFRAFERGGQEYVYLPDDVRQALPAPAPASHDLQPRLESVPPAQPVSRRAPAGDLVDDCCTLLAFAQRNLIPAQPPLAPPEEPLLPYLRCKDRARLQMIWSLALDAGWLAVDGEALRPERKAARAWLQTSYPEQAAALAQTWLHSSRWNELWHVPSLQPEPTGWQNDPRPPRQLLLSILGQLDRQSWWWLESLPAGVKATQPDVQRTGGEYDSWYLRDATTGEYLLGFQHWDRVEGALLCFLITGPLFWLGLVELGEDGTGEVIAFRPTPAGNAFAQVQSFPYPPRPTEARIRIYADATIQVPAATNRLTRFQVARLTDWEPLPPGGGAVYGYRLTPRSLGRASQANIPLDRALTFLASRSGQPLPESVREAVESWQAHGVLVRLRQVNLLQVRDEAVLDRLRAAPAVRPLLGEAVGPLAVTVRTADWGRVISAIAELGLLSELEG